MIKNARHYLAYLIGRESAVTQTTDAERQALVRYAHDKSRIVEVGVFEGVNSLAFRTVMNPDGVLIAIDPYQRSFLGIRGLGWARRIAHREVRRSKKGTVE
jgi:predicted O-methyltransferase YrrM